MTVARAGTARLTRAPITNAALAIKLLVVSNSRIHRVALTRLLASVGGVTLVGAVGSAEEALASTVADSYEVVLFDLVSRNCLLEVRELIRRRPSIRAVSIGVPDVDDAGLPETTRAHLAPNAGLADLIMAIENAVSCRSAHEASIRVAGLVGISGTQPDGHSSSSPARLTTRQEEILELIDCGFSNRAIAQHLHIEEATVKNHVHNILKKLNVPSRGLAAARFRFSREGLQR
jgi:two-component system, NarL family, nitrate/nitrite response regulator NarL